MTRSSTAQLTLFSKPQLLITDFGGKFAALDRSLDGENQTRGTIERYFTSRILLRSWETKRPPIQSCHRQLAKEALSHIVYRLAGQPQVSTPERGNGTRLSDLQSRREWGRSWRRLREPRHHRGRTDFEPAIGALRVGVPTAGISLRLFSRPQIARPNCPTSYGS